MYFPRHVMCPKANASVHFHFFQTYTLLPFLLFFSTSAKHAPHAILPDERTWLMSYVHEMNCVQQKKMKQFLPIGSQEEIMIQGAAYIY